MWFLSSSTKVKTAVHMAVCKCVKSKKYRSMLLWLLWLAIHLELQVIFHICTQFKLQISQENKNEIAACLARFRAEVCLTPLPQLSLCRTTVWLFYDRFLSGLVFRRTFFWQYFIFVDLYQFQCSLHFNELVFSVPFLFLFNCKQKENLKLIAFHMFSEMLVGLSVVFVFVF